MATTSQNITEAELRSALLRRLSATPASLVVEEFRIEHGAARIDVARIDDRLCGYEIKSDFDGTARLFNQIHAYNRVFEEIYLVATTGLLPSLTGLIPSWWGILEAQRDGNDAVALREIRAVRLNRERDPVSILTLLRRDELLCLATQCLSEPKRAAGATRNGLYDMLASALSVDEICKTVVAVVKDRANLTLGAPSVQGGD